MQEDLEKAIEKKKRDIAAFIRISKYTGLSKEGMERDLTIS